MLRVQNKQRQRPWGCCSVKAQGLGGRGGGVGGGVKGYLDQELWLRQAPLDKGVCKVLEVLYELLADGFPLQLWV